MSSSDPCVKAVSLAKQGEINQALSKLNRCKKNIRQKLKKFGDQENLIFEFRKQLVKALRLEAQLYISKNVVSKAVSLYREALSMMETLQQDNEIVTLQAHILYSLALIDFVQNNLEDALITYQESCQKFQAVSLLVESAEIMFRVVDILAQLNQVGEAWQVSRELNSTIKKIKNKNIKRSMIPRLHLLQARLLFNLDNHKDGLKSLAKAKKEYQKSNDQEGAISVLIDQSRMEPDITDEKKEDLLLEALEISTMIKSIKFQALTETELGLILIKRGQFNKGKKRLLRGLKLKTEIGDKSGTAQSLIELSRISLITSQSETDQKNSKDFATQALELFSELQNDYGKAQALELIGTINTKLGLYEDAHIELRKSRKLFKKFKDINAEARTLTQIGIILDLKGDLDQALVVLDKAEILYSKKANNQGLAEVLQLKGNLTQDKTKALSYFKRSRDLYSQIIGNRVDLKPILFSLDVKIQELSS